MHNSFSFIDAFIWFIIIPNKEVEDNDYYVLVDFYN